MLIFAMRLASSPPEAHQGWIGDDLPSMTVTDVWTGQERTIENYGYTIRL